MEDGFVGSLPKCRLGASRAGGLCGVRFKFFETLPIALIDLKRAVGQSVLLLAASGFALTATELVHAAEPTILVSGPSQRCLDVATGSQTPRTPTILFDCHGGANQKWELTAASELRTFGGARCLDVRAASTAPQAIVQSYTCNGGANQKWTFKGDGTIVGAQSGLCLTVAGADTENETGIDMWPCSGLPHQKWSRGTTTAPPSDIQAPNAPSGLIISALACRSAKLTWKASKDNVGVAFYDIYRDGQTLGTVNASTLSRQITLSPGANWGLYVNARDAAGNVSRSSTTLQLQVPPCQTDIQAPTVPAALRGTITGTTGALSWAASTDDIGVTAYDIYRNNVRVGSTDALTYIDSGLGANSTYQYAVAARDAQNNASRRSVTLSLTSGRACSTSICTTREIASDFDIPWGLVTLPDGNVLYSRRDAQDIVLLNPSTGSKKVVGKVPNVKGTDGEGGLLGLAVTAAFPEEDPWLYIYHTSESDNRIVRVQYKNGALVLSSLEVLLSGMNRSKYHNGGRLRFGPDGKLYATVGDAENGGNAQNTRSLSGKILRLNRDGTAPSDNPFGNYVWSYGHRNPQGLAFDSRGRLWAQEFGETQDETNLIVKGGNYGWPRCEGVISRVSGACATSGYIAPKYTYRNSVASCSGIAIVRDTLYIACLAGKRLYRSTISGTTLTNVEQHFVGTYGRLRTVEPGIDGSLWLATSDAAGDKDSIPYNGNTRILNVTLGN